MNEKSFSMINQISEHIANAEREKQMSTEDRRLKFEKEKAIIEGSGARELFEDIRDSGIVKWLNTPVNDFKEGFFGGRKLVKVSEYTPAIVNISSPNPRLDSGEVFLSLNFNHSGDDESGTYDSVIIKVENGKLCIINECSHTTAHTYGNKYTGFYTSSGKEHNPGDIVFIEDGKLEEEIVKAIKKPIKLRLPIYPQYEGRLWTHSAIKL